MQHTLRRVMPALALVALIVLAAGAVMVFTQPSAPERRMSFHNRLLLNRAVLSGLRSIEVLLVVTEPGESGDSTRAVAAVSRLVTNLSGRVDRTEAAVGYLRVHVPTERLVDLVASPAIDAYQISSLSKGTWYRDGPPMTNAQMLRGFEVTPVAATEPAISHPELPLLSPAEASEPGFTADDAGVGQWLKDHPTFDGRGVTIALVENALPSFTDPTLRSAKTLDGRDVPKLAGILNVLDPAESDETRVRLDREIDAPKSWTRIGLRTYILPRPGRYRFGVLDTPAGANVVHQFAVIEDQATREVWIDADGDASFQNELPLADVNERFDPRMLKVAHPRKADVSFVMGRGREPHVVYIYMARGSHQSMTLSVAAGSRSADSLAYGVAPNARVLLVRKDSTDSRLGPMFESFIEAARRPDVDVIGTSSGVSFVPDTATDFAATLFRRLVDVYQKPIVFGAGNNSLLLASTKSFGSVLSVGGITSPATWAALYGGRPLEELIVSPISAAGPTIDGAIKPDFLAPMELLSADLPWNTEFDAAPRNAPTRRLPPGYQISCCTSSTSPYATGVAALLISAAKQSRIPYQANALNRAMKVSARLLPRVPAHYQGNGALDISAAWLQLVHPVEPPRIVASATIVHPLAQYAARGPKGEGIFELEGWTAGMQGTREITFRRESGPAEPATYRLQWEAGDGTFSTDSSLTLPLAKAVSLPVRIDVKSPGEHSGLLTLRDPATNTIAFRTQATVVAAERFDPSTRSLRLNGTVGLMRQKVHYVEVPAGVGAIAFELEVTRGVVQPTIVPSHNLYPSYYPHVHPNNVFFAGKGKYHVRLPHPQPGPWAFRVEADSTWFAIPGSPVPPDGGDAEYVLTVRLVDSSIQPYGTAAGAMAFDIENTGSTIAEPVLQASPGYLTTHHGTFLPTGLPNVIDIAVPEGATTLSLQLRSEHRGTNTELYLYDCTTGECFSYNIGFPAAGAHTLVVRKPNAGRWVAAVNAAPFPTAAGAFVLDEVITTGSPVRQASGESRAPGARWRQAMENAAMPAPVHGKTPILLLELLDAAAERADVEHSWSTRPNYLLRDRPVAVGTATYRR